MSASPLNDLATAQQRAQQRFAGLLQASGLAADTEPPAPKPCAVYISAGLHRGATLRLRDSARLGSAEDNDIVLRDAGVRPHHAELKRVDGIWSVFAAGDDNDNDNDSDSDDGLAALPSAEAARRGRFRRQRHVIGEAELVLTQTLPPEPLPKRLRRSLLHGVAPLLLTLSAVLGIGVTVQLVQPAVAHMPAGTRNLEAQGWPDVDLVTKPDNALLATGYVGDHASLIRLRLWLEQEGMAKAEVKVRIGSDLALRVRDALADPTLSVTYAGRGTVRVQGTSDDMAVRERLRLLTSDLAGVVRIDDRVAFYQVPDTTPKQHSLPVRIVGVMPGKQGSFSSDKGTRYFVGGVLPDGAEVLAIRTDAIEFAVGDRRITYPLN